MRQRALGHVQHGGHVHVDHGLPKGAVDLAQPFAPDDAADVIDQNIDAAEKFCAGRDAAPRFVGVDEIGIAVSGLLPERMGQRHQRLGAAFVAVVMKIDVATGLDKPLRGGAADALFRPGDKDLFARKIAHD